MKRKRAFWVSVTTAVLMGLVLSAYPVVAGTVNFDNISTGSYVDLQTGGVTFSATDLRVATDTLAVTPPNVLLGQFQLPNLSSGTAYFPIITMTFDQPQFYVTFHELGTSVLVSSTGFVDAIVAQAFDQQGNLLDQDRLFLQAPLFYEYNFRGDRRVTLSADGITKVTFGALVYNTDVFIGEFGTEIDNLAFCACTTDGTTNPVPIPASFILLGSGLLGMVGLRKKFKA
jgi:hypothetical protein